MLKTKETCWYKEIAYEQMIKGAQGILWPKLEKSSHWPVLKELISQVPTNSSILDLGCGAASLADQEIIKHSYHYVGFDLPGVLKNVAKKLHPDRTFISGDVFDHSINLIVVHMVDCVLMNAFLDVMLKPIEILTRVLLQSRNYVIIHRQFVGPKNTHVKQASSYGGTTHISYINEKRFQQTVKNFDILRKESTNLGKDNYSFLLKRKKI